jgi:hypothetical protein
MGGEAPRRDGRSREAEEEIPQESREEEEAVPPVRDRPKREIREDQPLRFLATLKQSGVDLPHSKKTTGRNACATTPAQDDNVERTG